MKKMRLMEGGYNTVDVFSMRNLPIGIGIQVLSDPNINMHF